MSKDKNFDLELVYDKEIYPLMEKVIEVCRKHKMPMFSTFQYKADPEGTDDGEDRFVTTNMPFADERPTAKQVLKLWPTLQANPESFMAFSIMRTNE